MTEVARNEKSSVDLRENRTVGEVWRSISHLLEVCASEMEANYLKNQPKRTAEAVLCVIQVGIVPESPDP